MKLYNYFRSGTSHRVRIAMNLKGLDYEYIPIHLPSDEHRGDEFLALNAQGLVPALDDDGRIVTQSLAIIEYLDARHPEPPLLPRHALDQARVRSLALLVACDIHPLNNLRVLRYLQGELGQDEEGKLRWIRTWIAAGFGALESLLSRDSRTGRFCHGDRPTLVDVCLVPQVFSANRFGCDLSPYPTVRRINEACEALPAFRNAAPELQPDAT